MADQQNGETKAVNSAASFMVSMPLLQQTGNVFVGAGAKKEAQFLGLGLTKLSTRQKDDLERAKRYAMEQSIKHVMLKQQISHQQNQQKMAMFSQALSLMARVYIGSISFEVREEQIKQHFSVFGTVKSINMSWDTVTGHHKGFAFLEYEVPEAALLAQDAMNGKLVGGRNLKVLPVGRPANMPQAQPIIEMVMQEAKEYNRVYVASVHPDLSEQDLKSVFEAFGEIARCQLAKQPGKGHRGFGYLEFKNGQAVKEAIDGMNNFDLGGQRLQVGRCVTPPDALTYVMPSAQNVLPTASAVAAAAVTAKIQAQEVVGGRSSPNNNGLSPSLASASPPAENNPSPRSDENIANNNLPSQQTSSSPTYNAGGGTSRRRGFGGFASAPVTSPAVVQSILPPQLLAPVVAQQSSLPPPVQLVMPTLSTPIIVQPPNSSAPLPLSASQPTTESAPPQKVKKDMVSRIKLKQPKHDATQRATFAPLPENIAPKDSLDVPETGTNGDQLAIAGGNGNYASTALALRDGSREVAKVGKDEAKAASTHEFRKKKKVKVPKEKMPKLNTPQALAAAEKAGAINDQMQAVVANNDEATIASQENVEIRGNDARHLLMHKLMRTNRSSVIMLKNMITADQIDDELEDEIRSECEKFGTVSNIVFAREDELTNEVRVFIKYSDSSQAEIARKAMDKRFFDGKTISATSYDQILFEHEDYSG